MSRVVKISWSEMSQFVVGKMFTEKWKIVEKLLIYNTP